MSDSRYFVRDGDDFRQIGVDEYKAAQAAGEAVFALYPVDEGPSEPLDWPSAGFITED